MAELEEQAKQIENQMADARAAHKRLLEEARKAEREGESPPATGIKLALGSAPLQASSSRAMARRRTAPGTPRGTPSIASRMLRSRVFERKNRGRTTFLERRTSVETSAPR